MEEIKIILARITKDWSDLCKVESDLRIIKNMLRESNDIDFDMYDDVVIQLDLLNSPDYGDFDGRVFRAHVHK